MKPIIYLLLLAGFAGGVVKYSPPEFSCTAPYYCSLDMRDSLFKFSLHQTDSALNFSYANTSMPSSYHDPIYNEDDCELTLQQDSCTEDVSKLSFHAYYPKDTSTGYTHYSTCPLPFVFLVHGGSYSECSSKEASDIKFLCVELAKRGFVAIDLDYRVGAEHATIEDAGDFNYLKLKTASQQLAVYKAVQDLRGAIRSICKMYYDGVFTGKFTIDTSKMFLGGASAGAGVVLSTTYLQKQDMIDEASPGVHLALGSLNQNYYYADTTYPMPTVKGVFSMWGDFPMPGTFTTQAQVKTFFSRNYYIAPVIAFHGDDDNVVPVDKRYENFPESGDHTSVDVCLSNTFTVTHNTSNPDLLMIGSLALRDLVLFKVKLAEVYIDCLMGHGIDEDCTGMGCTYQTEFGTALTTKRDVQIYMVQRAAVFFQSIILGFTTLPGLSTFIEKKNTRYNYYNSGNNSCNNDSALVTSGKTCTNCSKVPDCP